MIYIVSMQKEASKTKQLLEFHENPYATHLYPVVFTKSGLMYAPVFVNESLEFRMVLVLYNIGGFLSITSSSILY